jgi:hypothetical protein
MSALEPPKELFVEWEPDMNRSGPEGAAELDNLHEVLSAGTLVISAEADFSSADSTTRIQPTEEGKDMIVSGHSEHVKHEKEGRELFTETYLSLLRLYLESIEKKQTGLSEEAILEQSENTLAFTRSSLENTRGGLPRLALIIGESSESSGSSPLVEFDPSNFGLSIYDNGPHSNPGGSISGSNQESNRFLYLRPGQDSFNREVSRIGSLLESALSGDGPDFKVVLEANSAKPKPNRVKLDAGRDVIGSASTNEARLTAS